MSVVEIRRSPERDPDGRKLRSLLEAIARVDRLGAFRSFGVHILAVLGVVLWIGVAFPGDLPDGIRRYAILGFAALAFATLIAVGLEWRWQRIQRRCMKENDVRVLDADDTHEPTRR